VVGVHEPWLLYTTEHALDSSAFSDPVSDLRHRTTTGYLATAVGERERRRKNDYSEVSAPQHHRLAYRLERRNKTLHPRLTASTHLKS
jgi:hypothetical protein